MQGFNSSTLKKHLLKPTYTVTVTVQQGHKYISSIIHITFAPFSNFQAFPTVLWSALAITATTTTAAATRSPTSLQRWRYPNITRWEQAQGWGIIGIWPAKLWPYYSMITLYSKAIQFMNFPCFNKGAPTISTGTSSTLSSGTRTDTSSTGEWSVS